MRSPMRRRTRFLIVSAVATVFVVGPAVTVLFGLGVITSMATFMDLHGFTAAMRLAVVGVVAVVVIPLGAWVCAKQRRSATKRPRRAQMRALSAETRAHTPSSAPARHRKVA